MTRVIILMIDCLREDAGRIISETLRSKGVDYITDGTIITPSPWTLPSMVSFFSGLYPNVHKIHAGRFYITDFKKIRASIYSLPYWNVEKLQKRGILTIGISTNILLSKYYGFDRGFDKFLVLPYATSGHLYKKLHGTQQETSRSMPDKDINTVRNLITKFVDMYDNMYLFSVLMNLHEPYCHHGRRTLNKVQILTLPLEEQMVEINKIRLAYYSSLNFLIRKLYRIITDIEDNSIIIIFGDHGQSLGEHGYIFHQSFLYNELIKSYALIISKDNKITLQRSLFKKHHKVLDLSSIGKLAHDLFFMNKHVINLYSYLKPFSMSFSYGTSHTPDYLPPHLYESLNNKYYAIVSPSAKITISPTSRVFRFERDRYSFLS